MGVLKSKLSVLLKNPYINALRGAPFPDLQGNKAQAEIARLINLDSPRIIARAGATEGRATAFYLKHRGASDASDAPYPEELKSELKLHSGYFPTTDEAIDEFARLYLSAIKAIDLYAAWTSYDAVLKPAGATTIRLVDLDPFFFDERWSLALENKRVCIVSPFVRSIRRQYELRDKLFATPTLPEFDLALAQAPMTHCESDVGGQHWIGNKDRLTEAVLETQPQVAIIGAGAYGLPVAHDLKKQGVTAIVMGGSTQLLFGLRGKRWENDRQYRALMNEHWSRPDETERPEGFQNLEIGGGAYW